MLDVKEAAQAAHRYFNDLYADNALSNVLVEEVERVERSGASYWLITLGFTNQAEVARSSGLSSLRNQNIDPRRYKQFKINAETGEVDSMKIRSVENA